MKSMLVFPPGWSPVGPYLALPVLKAYLKEKREIDVCIRDLNVLFYDELLSRNSISSALDRAETAQCLSSKERLTIDLVKSSALEVEWAKRVFRSEEYFDLDKRERAQNIFRNALYVLNHSDAKVTYSFNDINLPYSFYSSSAVMAAAKDSAINPFIEFYLNGIVREINKLEYEFLGISVSGSYQVISAITLAKVVKEKCPSIKHVALGGNYITRLAEKTFDGWHPFFEYIDSIMLYDGEEALASLITALENESSLSSVPSLYYVKSGKICKNEIATQQFINDCVPDFTGFALDKYFMPELVLPIYSSRQCFNHCTFCTIPGATAGKYRAMPVQRVYDIMCALNERYGSRIFSFVDETFESKRMVELANIINHHNKEFYWHGETRFTQKLSSDDCTAMYRSGCRQIQLGLESYNQRVLDLMKKNIKLSWIDRSINDYLSAGIPVHLFFMIGFPTETEAEAANTIRYTEEILYQSKTKYNVPYSTRGFAQFGLDIGSDVWNHPKNYGVHPIPNTADYDLRLNVRYEATCGLSPYEAKEIVDQHHIDFYLRSLIDSDVPLELPERLHISEVTWILDSIRSVNYKNGIRTRKAVSILQEHAPIKLDDETSMVHVDGRFFFYNVKTHSTYSVSEAHSGLIDNMLSGGLDKRDLAMLCEEEHG